MKSKLGFILFIATVLTGCSYHLRLKEPKSEQKVFFTNDGYLFTFNKSDVVSRIKSNKAMYWDIIGCVIQNDTLRCYQEKLGLNLVDSTNRIKYSVDAISFTGLNGKFNRPVNNLVFRMLESGKGQILNLNTGKTVKEIRIKFVRLTSSRHYSIESDEGLMLLRITYMMV